MHVLSASNLAKGYRGHQVVKDVSIDVASGQVVGLLGPNGAGQTISFERVTRLNNINDSVSEAGYRGKLHCAIKLNNVHLDSLGGIISLSCFRELRRNAQPGWQFGLIFQAGDHNLASTQPKIQRLIETDTAVLQQHILTRHT